MLKEAAIKFYQQGYNCAESILHAGNEVYGLDLHEEDMRMVAAFGGGFQIGDVCGALSGAACVISSKYVENKAHDYVDMRALTQKLVLAFQKRLGSRLCAQIKPTFHSKELKCQNTVAVSAEVLEQVIEEWEEMHK
ncbi:MAG: C-GCAxxG-C-C family (seleno)protein [Bacilli bacterium]|nr:C-GCAxxG-C-C family (seleno)protein [Bacilli bacterium]